MKLSKNVTTLIVILFVCGLLYIIYNNLQEQDPPVLSEIIDRDVDVDDVSKYNPKSNDPYTVSIGNSSKHITRCKPIPPVEQVPIIDFDYDNMDTPNSRGNTCKYKLGEKYIFSNMTTYDNFMNTDTDKSKVYPVTSTDETVSEFNGLCYYKSKGCNKDNETSYPGQLLIDENVESTNRAELQVLESYEKYDDFVEGYLEHGTNDRDVVVVYYKMKTCPHCIAFNPQWEVFEKSAKAKGIKATSVEVNEGLSPEQKKNGIKTPAEAGVKGYPTVMVFVDGKAIDYPGERTSAAIMEFVEQQ
jgi:thiol-disulfide isomerase/thioredoxin